MAKGGLGDLVKVESMIQLGIALPAGCVVGWLGGAALDKHFGTHWMTITGILLGAVAGFVRIFQVATGYLKNGEMK